MEELTDSAVLSSILSKEKADEVVKRGRGEKGNNRVNKIDCENLT